MIDRPAPAAEMATDNLVVGTHRRAHRGDPIDLAHGLYLWPRAQGTVFAAEPALVRTAQPGWVARHPALRVLYAVNEVREHDGYAGGAVSAFALVGGGAAPIGERPTPPMPCHCAVDATGRCLLVATFGGGSVHLFSLADDGTIGEEVDRHVHQGSSIHPRRQTQPHAHAVVIDPGNRFVLVPDLGIDRVLVYRLDAARRRLTPLPERDLVLPPGSGPRHLVFSANARFVYLMNEMSAAVVVASWDAATGGLELLQSVDLLPAGFTGHRSGAAIGFGLGGRYLYVTTRSHGSSGEPPERGLDSLAWCSVDATTGRLAWQGRVPSGGEIPRSFVVDDGGALLLVGHQASGTIDGFRLDRRTGAPQPLGTVLSTPVPVCLAFFPDQEGAGT